MVGSERSLPLYVFLASLLLYVGTSGGSLSSTDAVVTFEVTRSIVEHGSVALPGNVLGLAANQGVGREVLLPFRPRAVALQCAVLSRREGPPVGNWTQRRQDRLRREGRRRAGQHGGRGGHRRRRFRVRVARHRPRRCEPGGCAGLRRRVAALAVRAAWIQHRPHRMDPHGRCLCALCRRAPRPDARRHGGRAAGRRRLSHAPRVRADRAGIHGLAGGRAGARARRGPSVVPFIAGAAAGVVLWALYNFVRFGSPWFVGYVPTYDFSGYYGLLFSPSASVFLYSPAIVLALAGIVVLARQDAVAASLLALPAVVLLLYYGALTDWAGGRSVRPALSRAGYRADDRGDCAALRARVAIRPPRDRRGGRAQRRRAVARCARGLLTGQPVLGRGRAAFRSPEPPVRLERVAARAELVGRRGRGARHRQAPGGPRAAAADAADRGPRPSRLLAAVRVCRGFLVGAPVLFPGAPVLAGRADWDRSDWRRDWGRRPRRVNGAAGPAAQRRSTSRPSPRQSPRS